MKFGQRAQVRQRVLQRPDALRAFDDKTLDMLVAQIEKPRRDRAK